MVGYAYPGLDRVFLCRAALFSPLAGGDADNYRNPGQISFLRAPFIPMDSDDLKSTDAEYAFIGVPFDEGNVGKPGCEDGPRDFRVRLSTIFLIGSSSMWT